MDTRAHGGHVLSGECVPLQRPPGLVGDADHTGAWVHSKGQQSLLSHFCRRHVLSARRQQLSDRQPAVSIHNTDPPRTADAMPGAMMMIWDFACSSNQRCYEAERCAASPKPTGRVTDRPIKDGRLRIQHSARARKSYVYVNVRYSPLKQTQGGFATRGSAAWSLCAE